MGDELSRGAGLGAYAEGTAPFDPERAALGSVLGEPLPDDLSSSQTKLVYLYLRLAEGGTVEDLRENLRMKTITLYPVLERLVERNLVTRQGEHYVCCRNT